MTYNVTFMCVRVTIIAMGKHLSITYSKWVFVALVIQHAKRMRCVILLSVACMDADYVWNVMAHAQKPDFVFLRNGQVHLNRRGHQFSRLLAAEVCSSAVVMLDTACSEVVWRVLATRSIRQLPLHFPSRSPPCAITFQLESTILFHISHKPHDISEESYWT
jgi:hypothetical protein